MSIQESVLLSRSSGPSRSRSSTRDPCALPVSSCIRSRLSPLVGETFFAAYWAPSGPPSSTIDTPASCLPSSPLASATPTPCGSRSGGSPERVWPSARPQSDSSPPCGPRSVGSTWVGRSPYKPDARRQRASIARARRRLFSWPGSEVSPTHLLEDADRHGWVRPGLLQTGILLLQLLQALHLVRLHPSILVSPAMEGCLADAKLSCDLGA